jgi:hypothetical protein
MTMNSDFTVLPVNILQNVGPNEKLHKPVVSP